MIYLIGGVPRCGKTTTAKALSKVLGVPQVSADYLASVAREFIPESQWPEKLPLRYLKHIKSNNDNDVFYSAYSAEEIMDAYIKQAETIWKGIENFIEYAISEDEDFIIEGHQIMPEFVEKLKGGNLWPHLKTVFIYKEDPKNILEGIKVGNFKQDWAQRHTKEKETFNKIANWVSLFGKKIKADAKEYGFEAFNMDGNFQENIEKVVNYLKK